VIAVQEALRRVECHGHRDQAGLGAVVQVALDPPDLGGLRVGRLGPGRGEPFDPIRRPRLFAVPPTTAHNAIRLGLASPTPDALSAALKNPGDPGRSTPEHEPVDQHQRLAAYGGHQLAEAARVQPGERHRPRRLRRRDHTGHAKFVSL
jgi:hypothetical protein